MKEIIKEQQDLEREERNKQREHQDKQRQHELEKAREQHEFEERTKQRECEMEQARLEQKRDEMELKLRYGSVPVGHGESQHGLAQDDENKGDLGITGVRRIVKGPKMPCFEESNDDMDSFLHRFEIYADSQGWKKEQWAVYLSALLKGRALEIYSRLPVRDAQN